MSASPAGCKVLVTTKIPEAFPSGSSTADVGPSYQRLVVSPMDNVALWAQSTSSENVAVDMADGGLGGFLEDLAAGGVGGSAGEHAGVRWKFSKYV